MPTRSQLARVHIAKRDLNLSDSMYRDLLNLCFGKRSAKNLSPHEVDALLLHFQGLGWGNARPARQPLASLPQLRKIEVMWMQGPGVRIKTLAALRHFLQHHFHISSIEKIKASQVAPILGAIRKIARHAGGQV
ncbi:MAG: regulatory protein GemA [Nitrospinae bacterium]|nr:regulatory protein GemA [Nitrospinota bacterium]